jgi:hypothetical protein
MSIKGKKVGRNKYAYKLVILISKKNAINARKIIERDMTPT